MTKEQMAQLELLLKYNSMSTMFGYRMTEDFADKVDKQKVQEIFNLVNQMYEISEKLYIIYEREVMNVLMNEAAKRVN